MEYTLNCNGKLLELKMPQVMGILNATPDSFYAGSRMQTEQEIAERTHQILNEGATIIDVGACSTRPDSEPATEAEEMERLRFALSIVRREAPEAIISIDTYRPDVARMTVEEYGADIINDVAGPVNCPRNATLSKRELSSITCQLPMFRMVSRLGVPYIYMSRKGTMKEVLIDCAEVVDTLRSMGQKDIILDPGFGFGKTVEQNYAVMQELERMQMLQLPLLVGISRKSMIYRLLGTTPEKSLNGTTMLNTISLQKGADILRVHDVKEAVEVVKMCAAMKS
ncbi:MAG: dihydropteroate synthase [Prevotella sp.]|nr:dihydropteroate synthase [Prevotella sp.]